VVIELVDPLIYAKAIEVDVDDKDAWVVVEVDEMVAMLEDADVVVEMAEMMEDDVVVVMVTILEDAAVAVEMAAILEDAVVDDDITY
jgi:hypothetical protein